MHLNDGSEGEEEPEDIFSKTEKRESSSARDARKKREEELRSMMDDDGTISHKTMTIGHIAD